MPALRRIDTHIHIVPPFYAEAALAAGAGPTRGAYPDWSPELHLEVMDKNDIDVAINSVVPGVHFLAPKPAREMARRCNEFAADLAVRWPSRFGSFALIPMHNPEDAVAEISYALDVLKHDGVYLLSSYGDSYLGDAVFDPVLEALNQREAVVFIHPFNSAQQLPGSGHKTALPYPAFMVEYPFDTTRMAAHLMFSGAIKRFPNIKFILAHAGGTLPYLAWRLYSCQMVSPKFPKWSYDEIRAGLQHFWYDTALSAGPEMIGCLKSMVGLDQIIFGSDWPFGNSDATAVCAENLSTAGFLSDEEATAISRNNALPLFPRLNTAI
jgi:predicted TIM-barrel fold metal-dependent hydrolase